jgi:hypothetical protein
MTTKLSPPQTDLKLHGILDFNLAQTLFDLPDRLAYHFRCGCRTLHNLDNDYLWSAYLCHYHSNHILTRWTCYPPLEQYDVKNGNWTSRSTTERTTKT